jgi:hypothetical protein
MGLEAPHVADKCWQAGEYSVGIKSMNSHGRANLFHERSPTVRQNDVNRTATICKSIRQRQDNALNSSSAKVAEIKYNPLLCFTVA